MWTLHPQFTAFSIVLAMMVIAVFYGEPPTSHDQNKIRLCVSSTCMLELIDHLTKLEHPLRKAAHDSESLSSFYLGVLPYPQDPGWLITSWFTLYLLWRGLGQQRTTSTNHFCRHPSGLHFDSCLYLASKDSWNRFWSRTTMYPSKVWGIPTVQEE